MTDTAQPLPPTPGETAEAYASLGWRVIPIAPGHKYPKGFPKWQEHATDDLNIIRSWYTGLYKDHGVGIVTGHESGIWVLDVDIANGKPGDDNLAALINQWGPLPSTPETETGTGGGHIYFTWDPARPITNGHATQLPDGLDIRGEGGFVVAAPTIHPCGTPYVWLDGCTPWDLPPAEAPEWLYDLLLHGNDGNGGEGPAEQVATPNTPPPLPAGRVESDSIADIVRSSYDWHTELQRDGWQLESTRGGDTHWTRPGKSVRDGASAVLHEPDGPLVVFTTTLPPGAHNVGKTTRDGTGVSWSLFDYLAVHRHSGNRSELAREARRALNRIPTGPEGGPALTRENANGNRVSAGHSPGQVEADGQNVWDLLGDDTEVPAVIDTTAALLAPTGLAGYEVDWDTLWIDDPNASEWLCEPIIPAGSKVTHIYAPRAEGKSAFNLYIAAALATGRAVLDQPAGAPLTVAYIDVEMSRTELRDYLEEYGYGPDTDFSSFHYLVDAPIPYLDTVEGGLQVLDWIATVNPDVVFVDSITSVLQGEENSNDAYQRLFNCTTAPLKRMGVPSVWTGNTGKDKEKGSRGGSRKEDLMDCIWRLERTEGGVKLTNTKKRASWIPMEVIVNRDVGADGVITYGIPQASMDDLPIGSIDTARLLDELGVPLDATSRGAAKALKEAGKPRRREAVVGGLRYRRWAVDKSAKSLGTTPGTTPEPPKHTNGNHPNHDAF